VQSRKTNKCKSSVKVILQNRTPLSSNNNNDDKIVIIINTVVAMPLTLAILITIIISIFLCTGMELQDDLSVSFGNFASSNNLTNVVQQQ